VKFIRVFLSLHSIQLIVISALLMTYLALTAVNRPNKTETIEEIPSTEQESVDGSNAESPNRGKNIDAIISLPTAAEVIFEKRTGLETASVTRQVIPTSNTVIVAEGGENEGGPAADQLLFDRRATIFDR
jgi:hypothetical protein